MTIRWLRAGLVGTVAVLLASTTSACGSLSTPRPSTTTSARSLTLSVGTLLPMTGPTAAAADSTRAAVRLAANRINAADLGLEVAVVDADAGSAGTGETLDAAQFLIDQDVDVIIGPRSSAQTLEVYRTIADAGIVEISPANTLPALSTIDDDGFYFRTSPSDVLQAEVLGQQIMFDGAVTVGIVRQVGSYGEAITEGLRRALDAGGVEVVADVSYSPEEGPAGAAASVMAAEPEAIVAISDAAGFVTLAEALDAEGVDWNHVYGTDASLEVFSGRAEPPSIAGAVFSSPGVLADRDFRRALLAIDPSLTSFNYAPEAYDAVVLAALAAVAADASDGTAIRDHLVAVSGGDGQVVDDFDSGAQALSKGEDIDYDGLSGPIDFQVNGDPGAAFISIYQYGSGNRLVWTEQTLGRLGAR